MNKMRLLILTLAMTAVVGAAQAQMTPSRIIESVPALPTPQQWATGGGHTEEFKAKMTELDEAAAGAMHSAIMSAAVIPTEADIEQLAAWQKQQVAQSEQTMQAMFGVNLEDVANMSDEELQAKMMAGIEQAMGGAMSQLQRQMQVLASLGLTEVDMKRMETMSDGEVEAFIKRRMSDNGISQAEFEKRIHEAGVEMLSDDEMREEELRQDKQQQEADAIALSQETSWEYMTLSRAADSLLREEAKRYDSRLTELAGNYKAQAEKLRGEMGAAVESNFQGSTDIDVSSIARRYNAVIVEWRTEAYRLWSEYIRMGQEQYRALMLSAEASDEAKAALPALTGVAAIDAQQRTSGNALDVAMRYLNLTGSAPEIEYSTIDEDVPPMTSAGGKG
jgi:mannose/fructose/N-acetylgalactosamine-specific phosphotransferase system component IIB